ncbi:hypothetical protein E2562_019123 [Oryza meyeriana var. granulata]|uniref:Uncharacterized protein n=1 Tax=Oryza meyeriana var. granulata TaxID=110450 RepID=A0A6G1CQA9_9ORYZ|nr:hypothetical protein E2562_019123 [Oryza meyeriana var. granulata]
MSGPWRPRADRACGGLRPADQAVEKQIKPPPNRCDLTRLSSILAGSTPLHRIELHPRWINTTSPDRAPAPPDRCDLVGSISSPAGSTSLLLRHRGQQQGREGRDGRG